MFVKLDAKDVDCLSYIEHGRDNPSGDVYINIDDISYIDGRFVGLRNCTVVCSERAIEIIINAIDENKGVVDC